MIQFVPIKYNRPDDYLAQSAAGIYYQELGDKILTGREAAQSYNQTAGSLINFALIDNKSVVGIGSVDPDPEENDTIELKNIAVTKKRQRDGLGTLLVANLEDRATAEYLPRKILVLPTDESYAFYLRIGYADDWQTSYLVKYTEMN